MSRCGPHTRRAARKQRQKQSKGAALGKPFRVASRLVAASHWKERAHFPDDARPGCKRRPERKEEERRTEENI